MEAPKLHFHVFRNGARDEAPLLPEEKAALHGLVEFELRRARVLARVAQRRAGQVNGTAAKVVQRPWLATVSGKPWDIAGIGAAVLDFSMHAVRFARQKMVLSLTLRGTVSRIQRTVRRRMLWRSIPNLWKTSNPSADAVVALEKLHVGACLQAGSCLHCRFRVLTVGGVGMLTRWIAWSQGFPPFCGGRVTLLPRTQARMGPATRWTPHRAKFSK